MVCVVRSMFAFVEKKAACVRKHIRGWEKEDAVSCRHDSSVFILFLFFYSVNITPSRSFGACGFQEIIRAERRKIGSVCICGERIYGERSQK